jgi:hypothetical protein
MKLVATRPGRQHYNMVALPQHRQQTRPYAATTRTYNIVFAADTAESLGGAFVLASSLSGLYSGNGFTITTRDPRVRLQLMTLDERERHTRTSPRPDAIIHVRHVDWNMELTAPQGGTRLHVDSRDLVPRFLERVMDMALDQLRGSLPRHSSRQVFPRPPSRKSKRARAPVAPLHGGDVVWPLLQRVDERPGDRQQPTAAQQHTYMTGLTESTSWLPRPTGEQPTGVFVRRDPPTDVHSLTGSGDLMYVRRTRVHESLLGHTAEPVPQPPPLERSSPIIHVSYRHELAYPGGRL